MKFAILAIAFLSTNAFATGSLWCAMSPYGTPTEVAQAGAMAYRYVQIDKMSDVEIQIDIDDVYNSTGEVFKATLAQRTGDDVSGIAQGLYVGKRNVEVKVENKKIKMIDGSATYNCEIPGSL